MNEERKVAGIYIRVSTEDQAETIIVFALIILVIILSK